MQKRSLFSTHSPAFIVCRFFDDGDSDQCEVISHCGFDLHFSKKVHLVKAMVFLVIMYGCESCTIRRAEHQRIDAFELWCWRRLFFFFSSENILFFFFICSEFCHTLE